MLLALAATLAVPPALCAPADDCVVLLHGLGRNAASMRMLEDAFRSRDYAVVNVAYPSRTAAVGELAQRAVREGVLRCPAEATLNFVTHSLGGILVRRYLEERPLPRLGRVVMLAPPNQGSELVDRLHESPLLTWLLGPAARQLGTRGLPARLGPVDYELGVIAGTRALSPLATLLPTPNDGLVAVERTKVQGMADFVALPTSHRAIVREPAAVAQATTFIATGHFYRAAGTD